MIIAIGVNYSLRFFSSIKNKVLIIVAVASLSFIQLYLSYFVLLKYERSEAYGFAYLELLKKIISQKDTKFVVDSFRELGTGIRFAFLKAYDPLSLQQVLSKQIKGQYYSNFEFDEPYTLDNIEARPIIWEEDIYKKQVLVGDLLAISDDQRKEHHLKFLFDIGNVAGDIVLKAYMTDPKTNCQETKIKGINDIKGCQKYQFSTGE